MAEGANGSTGAAAMSSFTLGASRPYRLTPVQVAAFRTAFNELRNEPGLIQQLEVIVRNMGRAHSEKELKRFISTFKNPNHVAYDNISKVMVHEHFCRPVRDMLTTFLETDEKKDGRVSIAYLSLVLAHFRFSPTETAAIVNIAVVDENKEFEYIKFLSKLMNTPVDLISPRH